MPVVPPAAYGLKGGLTGGLPFTFCTNLLVHLLGSTGSWLPLLVFFPLGALSISRFVGGGVVARLGAALVFLVNPFVLDRTYAGQLGVLFGYALLPSAVSALRRCVEGGSILVGALLGALEVALTPHMAWILLLPGLGLVATSRHRLRAFGRLALAGVLTTAMSAYVVVAPVAAHMRTASVSGELTSYATQGDPRVGLFVNVLGLYGFWRPGPVEPKDLFAGWPIFLVALLALAAYGVGVAWQVSDAERRVAVTVTGSAVAGYFLALGDKGPTAAVYRAAIAHLPGFVVMREPEKFVMLVAFAYAAGAGWALEHLRSAAVSLPARSSVWVIAIALPFIYTPNLVGGVGGQIEGSTVPPGWSAAARLVGSSSAVFYPWSSYLRTEFAGGRSIASAARSFLPGSVLTSADPGAGYSFTTPTPEDTFLNTLGEDGYSTTHAGAALAALGLRYVVLGKIGPWQSYGWLSHQSDLTLVYRSPSVEVWRVDEQPRSPEVVTRLVPFATVAAYLTDPVLPAGSAAVIGRRALTSGHHAHRRRHHEKAAGHTADGGRIVQLSPVAWQLPASAHGWVSLPVPFQSGWQLDGRAGRRLAGGNLAVYDPGGRAVVRFVPYGAIEASYLISLLAVAGVAVALVVERRRKGGGGHG